MLMPAIMVIALLGLGVVTIRRWGQSQLSQLSWSDLCAHPTFSKSLLIINSAFDEASQLLHHLVRAHNPLAPRTGLVRYLVGVRKNYLIRRKEIAALHGVRGFLTAGIFTKIAVLVVYSCALVIVVTRARWFSDIGLQNNFEVVVLTSISGLLVGLCAGLFLGGAFFAALISPFMLFFRQASIFAQLPSEVITYVVRMRAWPVFQRIGLGLEAYPHCVPVVSSHPVFLVSTSFTYENLSSDAVKHIVKKRDAEARGAHCNGELQFYRGTRSRLVMFRHFLMTLRQTPRWCTRPTTPTRNALSGSQGGSRGRGNLPRRMRGE